MARSLRADLARRGLGGVFFLRGDDAFSREEELRHLIEAHIDAGVRDFNLDQLRGSTVDVDTLASILATPPMMAEWRVVVIRDADPLAGSSRARTLLLDTAGAPPAGLALVISADTSGSKARFWPELGKAARTFSYAGLKLDDLPGWLVERARDEFAMTLEEGAARALAQAVGTNLGVLQQELQKLQDYVGGDRAVTRDDVAAVGTHLPVQDRWEWVDLVAAQRFGEAAGRLALLLSQPGESGVGTAIALGTMLLRMGVLVDEGAAALEKASGPRQWWAARKLIPFGRHWSADEVDRALTGLLRVDQRLKSSPTSADLVLEEWLLGLEVQRREAA